MENIQKHYTVPPSGTAPSLILDEGHRLRRAAHSFSRVVPVFFSGSIDSSAFQDVSSGREVSIIFTSNGPLIYRWDGNSSNNRNPRAVQHSYRGQLMRSL